MRINKSAFMRENILIDKTIAFAARIIKLNQHLVKDKKENHCIWKTKFCFGDRI